jgi:hypothetical protein
MFKYYLTSKIFSHSQMAYWQGMLLKFWCVQKTNIGSAKVQAIQITINPTRPYLKCHSSCIAVVFKRPCKSIFTHNFLNNYFVYHQQECLNAAKMYTDSWFGGLNSTIIQGLALVTTKWHSTIQMLWTLHSKMWWGQILQMTTELL